MNDATNSVRVLHVLATFGTGGTEQGVINLVNRTQGKGILHEICIFDPIGSEESIARIEHADVRVHCINKGFGNDPRLPLRLRRLFRSGGYDVVHSRGWPTYLETGFALLLRAPVAAVHSEHGTSFLDARRRRIAYGAMAGRWDEFLFVSHRLRSEFVERTRLNEAGTSVIPNGVDFDRFQPQESLESLEGFDDGWFHVGTVGRFHEVKNHRLILECARQACEAGRKWRFHFAGDGELRGEYEAYVAEFELQDHVRFHGVLHDVAPFYAMLDLFVLTSHREGHPNALLEALASGVAVACTPVGDVERFISDGKNGYLIDPAVPEFMTKLVDQVAGSPSERTRVADQGRTDAFRVFDIDVMMDSYRAMYRRLVDSRRR